MGHLATKFSRRSSIFSSNSPLSNQQMREVAPSIFAEEKHPSRSARYTYIPTVEILNELSKEGFNPFMVAQSRSRLGMDTHTKHMVRLRHDGVTATYGDAATEANEIILVNSHNGGSSYQMLAGVFRFVCCNGLINGDVSDDIRVPHKGDIMADVIKGAYQVLQGFSKMDEAIDRMKRTLVTMTQEENFAKDALEVRFGKALWNKPHPVTTSQALFARRPEDQEPTLWNTFQRLQENLMTGMPSDPGRTRATRAVRSIDGSLHMNRMLWTLAELYSRKGR
jgi:hypothetical protein